MFARYQFLLTISVIVYSSRRFEKVKEKWKLVSIETIIDNNIVLVSCTIFRSTRSFDTIFPIPFYLPVFRNSATNSVTFVVTSICSRGRVTERRWTHGAVRFSNDLFHSLTRVGCLCISRKDRERNKREGKRVC